MTISPDGRRIAAASFKYIQQWDAESGETVGPQMEGHGEPVNDLAYSPDGTYLVSTSTDNTVRFWDADTGDQIGEPIVTTPAGKTSLVDFSHDGRRVFVVAQRVSLDGNPPFVGGGIWQLPAPAAWKDVLCDKLTSNPSDEEWRNWISPDIDYVPLCDDKPRHQ